MHNLFQDYGSLLMGAIVIFGLFMSGMVSIWREEARRGKQASLPKQNGSERSPVSPLRR